MSNNPTLTRILIIGGGVLLVALLFLSFWLSGRETEPEDSPDVFTDFPISGQSGFDAGGNEPVGVVDTTTSPESNPSEFRPDVIEPQTSEFIPDDIEGGGYSDSEAAINYLNAVKNPNSTTPNPGNASTFEYTPELIALLSTIQNNPEAVFSDSAAAQYFAGWTPVSSAEEFYDRLQNEDWSLESRVDIQSIIDQAQSTVVTEIETLSFKNCGVVGVEPTAEVSDSVFINDLAEDSSAMCLASELVSDCDTAKVRFGGFTYMVHDVNGNGQCRLGIQAQGFANLCAVDQSGLGSSPSSEEVATVLYNAIASPTNSDCVTVQYQ